MIKNLLQRLFFWYCYLKGHVPWDTGVTPPELTALIEEGHLCPGRAIDLGCGTGTNAVYLAQHGWDVIGVDYVVRPIQVARRKAAQANVAERTRFIVGDVTELWKLDLGELFDLAIDIGCGHSLSSEAYPEYIRSLAQIVRPGGIFMLYMFRPTPGRRMGFEPEVVEQLFGEYFRPIWIGLGDERAADVGSAWYRFERRDQP